MKNFLIPEKNQLHGFGQDSSLKLMLTQCNSMNLPQRLTAVPITFQHTLSTALLQSGLEPQQTLSEDAPAMGPGMVRAQSGSPSP